MEWNGRALLALPRHLAPYPSLPFPLCPCLQGLLYLYLLPVAAVAFTLLILTANVDPSGPSLRLTLRALEQFTPVPLANNPAPGDDAAQRAQVCMSQLQC